MYVSKGCIRQENEKKIKMLVLFNKLPEEDKDFVISMSDSLLGKYRQRKNVCPPQHSAKGTHGCLG